MLGLLVLPVLAVLLAPTYMVVVGDEIPEGGLEQSGNITIFSGKDTAIRCAVRAAKEPAVTCLWLWEYPKRNDAPTVVAGFPGHGPSGTDCSINLVNVSQIQTGWWTCRAQTFNSSIMHTDPVFLQVLNRPEVTFEVKPTNRTLSVGSDAELECTTKSAVQGCQWRFQQEGQSEPIVVTEGPPKDDTDCSFQMAQVSYEQAGTWTCGARIHDSDIYTYTPTITIQVEHKEEAYPVEFLEEPTDTEIELGRNGRLQCTVHEEAHIEDCRWYWQPLTHSRAWRLLMREFLPENNDCSIELTNVTADPEGLWTCHVKPIHSDTFKISKTARLVVLGDVSISVLTRDITISEGEPLVLACVAEQPAKSCQWKRKEFDKNKVNPWTVEEPFPSMGHDMRDCSLHIEHTKLEHQGIWICGIQLYDDHPFLETMPTAVTVKVPSVVRFVDTPRTQLAAEDMPVKLNCSTFSAVRECLWSWVEDDTKVAERLIKYNFTADKDNSRDCSVIIPKVDRSLQGIWQCGVKYGDAGYLRTSYAPPFSLTVVKKGPVIFKTVSKEKYIREGGSGLLECAVREPVEECVWLYQEDLQSPTQEISKFAPKDFNNCSIQLSDNFTGGWWTCGARNTYDTKFTMSTPLRVTTVQLGDVTTSSLIISEDTLMLVCRLAPVVRKASCEWIHPSDLNVFQFNSTGKYQVESNSQKGECSVKFSPVLVDVGHWTCRFSVNNRSEVLGEAYFTVLSSPDNVRLSWVVGVLATVTLILTVLLCAIVTCRVVQCSQSTKTTMQLAKTPPEPTKRYSEDPTKGINFSFNESPEVLVDFSMPSDDSHHYERVGRHLSQRPSFYQNVRS